MNQPKQTYAFHLQENFSASFPSGRFGPVAPVAYHRLVGIALSDPGTAFGNTPSISVNPIGFTLGVQRKILNFGVLILFTKFFTFFLHSHLPVFDPKEFLFDPV